jgi:hypothetical protein
VNLRYTISRSAQGFRMLEISFQDQPVIELDVSELIKENPQLLSLYDSVNEYVDTLPVRTQEEIYQTFYKLYFGDYRNSFEDPETVTKLELKIAKVTELLNYNNFKIWMNQQSHRIGYPDNIKTDYVHDPDMNTTIEKTYIKSDYTNLIALIVFLRMLTPLYSEYHNYIRLITPHHYFRVYMLLVRSGLKNTPEMEKLRTYIDVNQQTLIGSNKNENLVIYGGLSDDDMLDVLVAEVFFNKLLAIDFFNKECNIISYIFQTVRYKGTFVSSDGATIRWKPVDKNPNGDLAYFEDYRKTSDVPIGIVVEIQHSLSDVNALLQALQKTQFDFERYNQEMNQIKLYLDRPLSNIQIYVLGWFMGKIINPRALYYIEPRKLTELMIFARCVLIQDGHFFMASFLGSQLSDSGNVVNVMIRNTLNKSLIKSLAVNFKFSMEDEKLSVIEKTLTEASREITNSLWSPILEKSFHPGVSTINNFLEAPTNINEIVFNYIRYCIE